MSLRSTAIAAIALGCSPAAMMPAHDAAPAPVAAASPSADAAIRQTSSCARQPAANGTWKAGEAVGFITPILNVDADGAPNSYLVDGNGLSFTCDGVVGIVNGHPVEPSEPNWQQICDAAWIKARATGDYSKVSIFGFLTDRAGKPVVQGQGDPLPDRAFVSTTSMPVPGTPEGTQRHYVDAIQVPYIVLPKQFADANSVIPGNLAIVYRPKTDKAAFAVFADTGPRLGEASVALHQDLGSKPIVKQHGVDRAKAGIDDSTVTIVFPGKSAAASADTAAWVADIKKAGQEAFSAWGGLDRIKDCTK